MTPDEARAMRQEPPLTAEQNAVLELVPLTVGPTGAPKPLPPTKPSPDDLAADLSENDSEEVPA